MKRKTILSLYIVMVLLIILSACSGTSNQTGSNPSSTNDASGNTSLSLVNMLLVGSLKLEDTDQVISSEEAAQLLPLWQVYRSLSTSDTAAEAEVQALVDQIQSTMTSEQLDAIKDMNLTNTEMMDLMQSLGGGRIMRGTPDPQSTPGFDFPAGGFEGGDGPSFDIQGGSGAPPGNSSGGTTRNFPPAGGMAGGGEFRGDAGGVIMGGGLMMEGTPDPSMQATAQARFGTLANRVNSLLLDILISTLETKTTN